MSTITFSSLLSEEHTATITTPEMPEIVSMPSRFEVKQESGFIDVWWLYDDGGQYYMYIYYNEYAI